MRLLSKYGFTVILMMCWMAGCSSITVKHHAVGIHPPLCKTELPKEKVAVYWGTAWRTDQKEPVQRGALAEKTIKKFFESKPCFEVVSISKTISEREALLATDMDTISETTILGADKILIIRIEELGPNLILYLSPILWQTKNEVLFHIRMINRKTESLEASVTTHWTRGGPFTFLGAGSLPTDLLGSLNAVFFGKITD